MESLSNNPSMKELILKVNELVSSFNNSLPETNNELKEVKKLVSFGSDILAGRLNAKLWYFRTQELMVASTELCEGDSCFVLKDGVTTGEGTFEYWYIYKTSDVVDIIDSYVDLSNPDLVAVKLQDMTLKDVKDTLSAQISDQSKDLNTKISNLRTDTETALSGKADLVDGLIPASQLPSYVDDIVESWLEDTEFPENAYAKEDTEMTVPLTPEFSKIYVNLLNNKTYRWGGNFYVEVSKSLAIGETATTAFAGDRGKTLETKIQNSIYYVTPEMFNNNVQNAIDYAVANKITCVIDKSYNITEPIVIYGCNIHVTGNGKLYYTGDDAAILIHSCMNAVIELSLIESNGYGIRFFSENATSNFNQYVTLKIGHIRAKGACIKCDKISGQGWTNEIHIYDTRLESVDGSPCDGVLINSTGITNGWRLVNVGFEGVVNGICINNTADSISNYDEIAIITPRFSESFERLIKTSGYVNFLILSENRYVLKNYLDLSNKTSGYIYGKITGTDYTLILNNARVVNGIIMPIQESLNKSYNASANTFITPDIDTVGYFNKIKILENRDYTFNLNEMYGIDGISTFSIEVGAPDATLEIKHGNSTLFARKKLINYGVYIFYFTYDNKLNYYCCMNNVLSPTKNNISTLTLTNCEIIDSYTNNGYDTVGNLVCVNLRVKAKSTSFTISGFPSYSGLVSMVAVSCKNLGNSNTNGYMTPSGTINVDNTDTDYEVILSCFYFANIF